MSNSSFVWFDNRSHKSGETIQFYEKLLRWKSGDGPSGMTMLLGESGPWAAISPANPTSSTAPNPETNPETNPKNNPVGEAVSGWIPFVEIEDLDPTIAKAEKLGAKVMQPRTKGPAGDYAVLCDPGGATFALWKRG